MKKLPIIILLLMIISCNFPKEFTSYEEAKKNCDTEQFQQGLVCNFRGFSVAELNTLTIESRNSSQKTTAITHFKMINYNNSSLESTIMINEKIDLNQEYIFRIANQTFTISHMKRKPKALFTMTTKNFKCLIDEMEINGTKYERMIEPILIKQ